ncbi:protein kinase [Trypanosoma grayi]|uniref:protein kinase n=1 Tax=Trypanosoma grayi TaxID=71804 RepID=UPI0004F473A2|nr:protein kinase [Trypanosoma grayi]KEG09342.1 protein kinase [Trypanosoma grayi]
MTEEQGTSQPLRAWLLLMQLDGGLRCISLADGKDSWTTGHPGGQLSYCGSRRSSETERWMWAHRPPRAACRGCKNVSGLNCSELQVGKDHVDACVDALDVGWEGSGIDCCLVSLPHGDNASAPPLKWCLLTDEWYGDGGTVGLPVDDVLECWKTCSCPTHRPVDLQQRQTSYMELDLFTGKVLSSLGTEADHAMLETVESSANTESGLRLAVQRTDNSRTLVFPLQSMPSRTDAESVTGDLCRSWYAVTSSVEFNVLCMSVDDSPCEPLLDARRDVFCIEQTLAMDGVTASLCNAGNAGGFMEMQLSISSPVVSAHIVWLQQHSIATGDGGAASQVSCEEIPVVNSTGHPRTHIRAGWLQQHKEHKNVLSGFLDGKRRVFFVDSITGTGETVPRVGSQLLPATSANSPTSWRTDDDDDDEAYLLFNRDDSGEAYPTSPSGVSSNALVLRAQTASFTSDNGGSLMPVRSGTSFFDENYEVIALLGRGASGAVLLTRHRVTSLFYAVKVLLVRDNFTEEEAIQEVRLHALLQNKYLVRYYACWSEAVTPCRVEQLASIGLCDAKEAKGMCAISGLQRIGWMGDQGGAINNNLLLAAPQHGNTGVYLAGDDSMESTQAASPLSSVGAMNDEYANSSSETSSSSTRSSETILGARVVFLQMEYCQTTLAHRLGSRTVIDRVENIIIALQMFDGLRYIHRCGCLHRDVKPTNIFLDYRFQMVATDDTSDDADDDDDDDDINNDYENGGGARDGSGATEWTVPGLTTVKYAPSSSAFELLETNASVGSLALHLRRLSDAKEEPKRRKAIRRVRAWLKRRLVQVRVGDFGLAKPLSDQRVDVAGYFNRSAINTVGAGSPLYSSPEQLEGNLCTAASDAYASGVVLAEMYLQPKTVSERLHELRRVREGVFPDAALLSQYPELWVVRGLTRQDPKSRMPLRDASRVLAKTADKLLLSFLLK